MTDQRLGLSIKGSAETIGLEVSPGQIQQLEQYARFVLDWNQKINLISRQKAEQTVAGHIADSLAALPLLDEAAISSPVPMTVMDLGSGGGFPGFPLKICRPGINLTCVEATQKKAKFLDLASQELALQNVTVVPQHSQELVKEKELLGKYDVVLCRAVAGLKELVKSSFPFLRPGGVLLAFKAQKAEQEIKEAEKELAKTHLRVKTIKEYVIDGKSRQIIVLEKQ
jgi:16S rRNA (guanine527-N7)-methyltransferase